MKSKVMLSVLMLTCMALNVNLAWGAEETLSQTLTYDTWTYSGSTTDKSDYRLFHSDSYIESAEFDLSTLSKVVVYGGTFGGDSYNKLTIGDGTNTWKSVTVSGKSQTGVNTYTDGTALSGKGKLRITSNSGTATSNGVRISKIEIYTIGGVTYTDVFVKSIMAWSYKLFNTSKNICASRSSAKAPLFGSLMVHIVLTDTKKQQA